MNDAGSRAGRESGTVPPFHDGQETSDEELETGEPIEDAGEFAPGKKIRARSTPFARSARQPDRNEPESSSAHEGSGHETGGQMVLTTAKYLPPQPPDPRHGQTRGHRSAQAEQPASSFEGRVINSGKWGGMLAMAVAAVWFMAGLANDMTFIYPPVLFVIGLAAFVKDATRSE